MEMQTCLATMETNVAISKKKKMFNWITPGSQKTLKKEIKAFLEFKEMNHKTPKLMRHNETVLKGKNIALSAYTK